jgi:hypothetical protein
MSLVDNKRLTQSSRDLTRLAEHEKVDSLMLLGEFRIELILKLTERGALVAWD